MKSAGMLEGNTGQQKFQSQEQNQCNKWGKCDKCEKYDQYDKSSIKEYLDDSFKENMIPVFKVTRTDRKKSSVFSAGNQPKALIGDYWVKYDYQSKQGLAESLVSIVLKHCREFQDRFVKYNECIIVDFARGVESNTFRGCYSNNFLQEGQEWVPFCAILERAFQGNKNQMSMLQTCPPVHALQTVLTTIQKSIGMDIFWYLSRVFMLDAIIVNKDRHFRNLGVIREGEIYKESPLFDNGRSLLCENTDMYKKYDSMDLPVGEPFGTYTSRVIACRQLGALPLHLDMESMLKELGDYQTVLYSSLDVKHCISIIKMRLEKLEGLAWI